MNKVRIKYNPYLVETEFLLDNRAVDNNSNFYYMQNGIRLQEWIEPIGDWKGIFREIFEYFNSSEKLYLA